MVLLTMETVKSVGEAVVYIGIFGLSTILGMLLSTTVIGLPFVLTASSQKVNHGLTRLVGLVSVCFGVYYMYSIGFVDGLFGLGLGYSCRGARRGKMERLYRYLESKGAAAKVGGLFFEKFKFLYKPMMIQ